MERPGYIGPSGTASPAPTQIPRQPTVTHTFATLEVSAAAYDEIARLLRDAGYAHAFVGGVIDMHGIGLVRRIDALTHWSLEDDPGRAKLPPFLRVCVDGRDVQRDHLIAFDVHEGYVRAECRGDRPGHPRARHLDQDTDRACEQLLRGAVEVRIE